MTPPAPTGATMGVGAAVAAVAHGATVVEKHFTLRRADGGVDSAFSLEPEEMKALIERTKEGQADDDCLMCGS